MTTGAPLGWKRSFAVAPGPPPPPPPPPAVPPPPALPPPPPPPPPPLLLVLSTGGVSWPGAYPPMQAGRASAATARILSLRLRFILRSPFSFGIPIPSQPGPTRADGARGSRGPPRPGGRTHP